MFANNSKHIILLKQFYTIMSEQTIKEVTLENIDNEHICCAFSDKKSQHGYLAKKDWLKSQFGYGYTFKKLDVRGKVFIEYVPAEYGWMPIEARDYMLINCFWVSGKYKKSGYARQLLTECLKAAENKNGVVVVTGGKKRPFLADSKFFKHFGFERVDTAPPYFELWRLKNNASAEEPQFKASAKLAECRNKEGLTVYYSNACPFTEYYVNTELQRIANERGLKLEINKVETREQAQNLPVPFFINSLFFNGKFVTHEILSEKRFDKLFSDLI